jgi:3',5'-cyclic-AMP phosphodiesterase
MSNDPPTALVVQLSDLHVGSRLAGRGAAASDVLRRALDAVRSLAGPVELVLLTGDLVEAGTEEQYDELFSVLDASGLRIVVLAGNHDDRARLRARLRDRQRLEPSLDAVCTAVDAGPLRVIGLDSCVAGDDAGRLGPDQCAWLDAELAAHHRPTIVALHHPPVPIGHALLDTMYLGDADELGAVVERHPHVERIVCGHAHRAVTVRWRGTVVTVAPSSIRQFAPAFTADAPFALSREQPALAVHAWSGGPFGGALATHVVGFDGRPDRP